MPYIIETNRLVFTTPKTPNGEHSARGVSTRTAVSTLEQARQAIFESHEIDPRGPHAPWTSDVMALPESGGTVGPLPDGTVIEVRPVTLDEIVNDRRLALDSARWDTCGDAEIIAAFNAA